MENNYCIIMAGGAGVRFWPQSRTNKPKQFIDILGTGDTLIQQTVKRVLPICPIENIYVVTNDMYRDLVSEQIPQLNDSQILCEPCRRNTAPCIAYATYKIYSENPEAQILVTPSDHVITDELEFVNIVNIALTSAKKGNIVTLGIKPSRPETGYGYINYNHKTVEGESHLVRKSIAFREKPDLETARHFIAEGHYLWNAGIFVWSAKTVIAAFEKYLPAMDKTFKSGMEYYNTAEEKAFIDRIFPTCQNISIDYGIMEKANNVNVVISNFGWSDVGTWGSLYAIKEKDENNNVLFGDNVMTYNTNKCIIKAPEGKMVSVNGLDDCIVVWDGDVLMICRKGNEQQIRDMVEDARSKYGEEYV